MTRSLRAVVIVAAAALIACLVAAILDPARTALGWVVGFAYAAGLCAAAIVFVAALHVSGAKWSTVLRRPLEALGAAAPVLAVLFLPLWFALPVLYPWASASPGLPPHEMEMLAAKEAWLNVPFFLGRAAVYLVAWIVLGGSLFLLSLQQDDDGGTVPIVRMRKVSAVGLPVLGLTITFAAFDWLMSLDPLWYSTIFGVYWFAGSLLAVLSVLTLVACLAPRDGELGSRVGPGHLHALGNLLFGFVVFWAYIAFSQYMLIWIADLPEEARWYVARAERWMAVRNALGIVHFAVPFVWLLPRAMRRSRFGLSAAAIWILCAHWLDLWWMIVPAHEGAAPSLHPADLAAPIVTLGALALAALLLARMGRSIPALDPTLDDSVRIGAS